MKKLAVLVLLFSLTATAEEVTKFEPRPAVVEQEGKSYAGILLSEEDFRKILEDKINNNAKVAECSVDRRVCEKTESIYKSTVEKLEEAALRNNSWFDRNRGTLGLFTGLVVGAGMSIAIVHGVYQK
jgi:hypothetical protein